MIRENITLILLAVIGLVFLIDFIKNNSKKSVDESVEEFVEKEEVTNSWLNVDGFLLILLISISYLLVMMYIDPPDDPPFFYYMSTGHLEAFRMFVLKFLYIPILLSIITYWYLRKIGSSILSYFLKRKKNITISLLLIITIKILIHYFFEKDKYVVLCNGLHPYRVRFHDFFNAIFSDYTYYEKQHNCYNFSQHRIIDYVGVLDPRLDLFIPVTIVFLIVVWFFNDKIKAQ